VLRKVRDARIDPPSTGVPNLPEQIDKIAVQALERERDRRFKDAREFDRALESAARELNLYASEADLQEWLRPIMPARQVEPLPAAGDLISFGGPPPPATEGTRKIPSAATTAKRTQVSRFAWLGLIAVMAGLSVFLVWFLGPYDRTTSPPDPDGTKTIAAPAIIVPDAGTKLADSNDAGYGAVADAGVAAAEPGADRRTVVVKRGVGTLLINSEPWAKIYIDGKDTGITTPTVDGIRLPAGRHRVMLTNPKLELSLTFSVKIEKNRRFKRFVDLRREGVQH